MDDNSKVSVLRKDNILVVYELGSQIKLQQTRVIKVMATNIISLSQLVHEGQKMSTDSVNEKR